MARLRGFKTTREAVIKEAAEQAIAYIDSGEIRLARGVMLAILNLYGKSENPKIKPKHE